MSESAVEVLWAEYLKAERDRIRDVTMAALDRFISSLLEQPQQQWRSWARRLAASVADAGADTPVRLPLFRRVLLPTLVEGVLGREPGCARWLASFESLIVNSGNIGLPPELKTPIGLLSEAVRIEPNDALARRRLVDLQASYFEYSLHELPAGVLYESDGATPDQCDELSRLLAEFIVHVALTQQTERFAELVSDCELHFRAYAAYLRSGPHEDGYESFLADYEAG